MKSFNDSAGRQWSLELNIPLRKRVQADTQFDLLSVIEPDQLEKLEDPELLVAVVFSLCGEQAQKIGLSPEQFAAAMTGDALDEASDALMGAIADFFPSRRRLLMQQVLAKQKELMDQATSRALEKINALTIDSIPLPSSKSTSTSSPALPESTSSEAPSDFGN